MGWSQRPTLTCGISGEGEGEGMGGDFYERELAPRAFNYHIRVAEKHASIYEIWIIYLNPYFFTPPTRQMSVNQFSFAKIKDQNALGN